MPALSPMQRTLNVCFLFLFFKFQFPIFLARDFAYRMRTCFPPEVSFCEMTPWAPNALSLSTDWRAPLNLFPHLCHSEGGSHRAAGPWEMPELSAISAAYGSSAGLGPRVVSRTWTALAFPWWLWFCPSRTHPWELF